MPKPILLKGVPPTREALLTTQLKFDKYATLLCDDDDLFSMEYYTAKDGYLGKDFWQANIFYGPPLEMSVSNSASPLLAHLRVNLQRTC